MMRRGLSFFHFVFFSPSIVDFVHGFMTDRHPFRYPKLNFVNERRDLKVGKELLIIYEASDKWNRVVIVSKSHRENKANQQKN
jgi:hypothetical protein